MSNEYKYVIGEIKNFFAEFMALPDDTDIFSWFNHEIIFFIARLEDRNVKGSLIDAAVMLLENKCIMP